MRSRPVLLTAVLLAAVAATVAGFTLAQGSVGSPAAPATPIHHVVVIFDENESYDHYFGTYPNATNPAGEPSFTAAGPTPASDNYVADPGLLTANPNSVSPTRIDRPNAFTCGNNHSYTPEQLAFHGGLMDKFPENTGTGCEPVGMGYFDGNTVTGLWNLAQNFAMSDHFHASTFGPSTPGALNLISGNTHGASPNDGVNVINNTDIGDPNPAGDDCGGGSMTMSGGNIGDRMNSAGVTWGWFQGGFKPTSRSSSGVATCGASHANIAGTSPADYSAHHEPFQYYPSTANPHHLPPTSVAAIGTTDQANHQYDLSDFDSAIRAGNLPQVSFLKAAEFEDAHPGYSDPLDEQRFIARTLDEIEQSPDWASTAVIITYDDSDGWYDHQYIAPTNSSADTADALTSAGHCGAGAPAGGYQDRCGPGPRLPFLVVSPYAKVNDIETAPLDQTSIMKFIEFNWGVGAIGDSSFDGTNETTGDISDLFDFTPADPRAPKVYLDPNTGEVLGSPPSGVTSAPPPLPTTSTTPPPTTQPVIIPPPTTTTQTTPKPAPKPAAFSPKLSFSSKKSGKKLTLKLKVTGLSTSKGKITIAVKLTKSKKTVASGKGTIKSGKLTVTLKAKKTLTKGTYTVSVSVTQAGHTKKFSKTLKLK